MSTDTEYAVTYTLPGETEERLERVGGDEMAAELLDDLQARFGVTGQYVSRPIPAWQIQTPPQLPKREQLERLAHRALNGIVPDEHLPARLAELTPLPAEKAMFWFEELCESVAALGLPWWEVVPDAEGIDRDQQADKAARARIGLALDALEGGAQ